MKELAEQGAQHIKKLTVKILKDLIKYVFSLDNWRNKDLRKPAFKAIAECKYAKWVKEERGLFVASKIAEEQETNDDMILSLSGSDDDDVDSYVEV